MATHIITVFCEGPHDVAFLTKILKSDEFKSNDKCKIGEFPLPYSKLLEKEAINSNVADLNLQGLRNNTMPNATLKKGENILFFYALGGDSRKDKRNKLLSDIDSFVPKSENELSILPEDSKLSILYFLDADNKGVDARLIEIGNEINSKISEINESSFSENGKIVQLYDRRLNIGVYIFCTREGNTGKLEDILVPIMKLGNDKIFEDAEKFIQENYDENRCIGNNFNTQKSIVGTIGQLQKSGSSNVVCISQTDFLSPEKILADPQCQEIIQLFNSVVLI